MDPRIRIHPKMSWIGNTADKSLKNHKTVQIYSLIKKEFACCPASPEKEDQRAAGSPAALTQLVLCLRFAPDLKGRELAMRRNPR